MHNIEHSAKLLLAECLRKNTRQTDNTRRKKPLPSAAWAALGNKCHVRHTSPHTPVTKVCLVPEKRHSAKPASQVEERPCAFRRVLHFLPRFLSFFEYVKKMSEANFFPRFLPSVFRPLPSVVTLGKVRESGSASKNPPSHYRVVRES